MEKPNPCMVMTYTTLYGICTHTNILPAYMQKEKKKYSLWYMHAIDATTYIPSIGRRTNHPACYAHKSCTIAYQGFQLWSPLIKLQTHVILVRVACGSDVHTINECNL